MQYTVVQAFGLYLDVGGPDMSCISYANDGRHPFFLQDTVINNLAPLSRYEESLQ